LLLLDSIPLSRVLDGQVSHHDLVFLGKQTTSTFLALHKALISLTLNFLSSTSRILFVLSEAYQLFFFLPTSPLIILGICILLGHQSLYNFWHLGQTTRPSVTGPPSSRLITNEALTRFSEPSSPFCMEHSLFANWDNL
jgi:hypothetical protein